MKTGGLQRLKKDLKACVADQNVSMTWVHLRNEPRLPSMSFNAAEKA